MTVKELYNILLSDKPSISLKEREEELFHLIPELQKCKGFNQNNEWHIYDVYNHILHVIDNVPPKIILRLTALFHDVGKPISYKEDESGIGHFYGHWEESQKIFNSFSNEHNIDKNISNIVSNLIFYHDINLSKLDEIEIKKIYSLLGDDGITMLYQFKKADLLAQNEKFHYLLDDYDKQEKRIRLVYK